MATINYLTRIEIDFGLARRLSEFCKEYAISKPLLVTDKGLVGVGIVSAICDLFASRPVVFDDTPANPTEAAVMAGALAFQENGCDGILAIGGGSPLDLAKGVRLMATHTAPLAQYAVTEGGVARIKPDMCPMIAVPTTAGTGSEVGRAALLRLGDGRKVGVLSPHLLPSLAVCDPELTQGLPPLLTAATGMDAMSHCLETFMGAAINPPADAMALDGLKRGYRALRKAVVDGSDREARWEMMISALEGALAFQKGLGAVHALSHPLGALPGRTLHHGTLNAILMPAVLRFNQSAIGEKWDRMAAILGGAPDAQIARLIADIGIPDTLSALDVRADELAGIAAAAMKDHCHTTNPRIATKAEYIALLEEAF